MIRQSPGTAWKAIAAGPVIAGAGWLLWLAIIPTQPVGADVIASLFAIGGGLAVCLGIGALISPPPALVIDRHGIIPDPRHSSDLILWSDLKGAHVAVVEERAGTSLFAPKIRSEIVALELVDPRAFYARLDAGKPRWLGLDTGARPDHFPIYCGHLQTEPWRLLRLLNEGIRRQGRPNPDPVPQIVYQPFFYRSPSRGGFAIAVAIAVLFVVILVLVRAPTWVEAGANCDVRNRYDGKQWRRAKTTTATWTGPCTDGRADGSGVLEWFRDGAPTVHYEGEMSGGRMTGRGELTDRGIRYDGRCVEGWRVPGWCCDLS